MLSHSSYDSFDFFKRFFLHAHLSESSTPSIHQDVVYLYPLILAVTMMGSVLRRARNKSPAFSKMIVMFSFFWDGGMLGSGCTPTLQTFVRNGMDDYGKTLC